MEPPQKVEEYKRLKEIVKMNVLFLTMIKIDVRQQGIYNDLMRKFAAECHEVYIVAPKERRDGGQTTLKHEGSVHTLLVRTLNLQKTNPIEKGIGQLTLGWLFSRAIHTYFKGVKFDLILYSTPPITFTNVIRAEKKQNPNALSYLMLKDIFPQNAIDIHLLSTHGIRGVIYQLFRKKEKAMYAVSDYIGCMSPANVEYVVKHNPEVNPSKVELCPNSMDSLPLVSMDKGEREAIRAKYGLPSEKAIFFYGGNLGKPQGIPFLISCLRANSHRPDCHFVIVGNGTEYPLLEQFVETEKPQNVSLFQRLPKQDYDALAKACDVGLIFLDYRFTIPNYPSRLLTCLMQGKPIIAATDAISDIGSIAAHNEYGYWCPSNNVEAFTNAVNKMLHSDREAMGVRGYQYFLNHYTTTHTYNAIMRHVQPS